MSQTIDQPPAPDADSGAGSRVPERPGRPDYSEEQEQRRALIRLMLVLAGAVAVATVFGVLKTVAVVFALIVMIMLHEAGHFVMAKAAGMKVTEFFVGFGTRLWSVRKGETEYGVKAIPAGGYVRIIGMTNAEEVDPEDESRTYRQKGYWRRLSVVVAGSTVHFILAFLLLWGLFAFVGQRTNEVEPVVAGISRLTNGPSPAQEAGFKVGDRILTYDGRPVGDWEEMTSYIRTKPGTPVVFEVERDGVRLTLTPTPVDRQQFPVEGIERVTEPTGFVGISPKPVIKKEGVVGAVPKAAGELGSVTKLTFQALGNLFSFQGMGDYIDEVRGEGEGDGNNRLISPIGFTRIAGQAAEAGWGPVLSLLALINVFVGIFNMIPLLPFDGGHVALATYEAVRSRKGKRYFVDGRKAMATAYPVIMLLFLIAITSIYMDLANPIENPFR